MSGVRCQVLGDVGAGFTSLFRFGELIDEPALNHCNRRVSGYLDFEIPVDSPLQEPSLIVAGYNGRQIGSWQCL